MTKQYPASQTSRTLDPSNRSFTTVIGKHDKRITDADLNLIQDLQDYKRGKVLDNMVFSGALQHKPFYFSNSQEQTFYIPSFDVMFNGEVVTIGGSSSSDLSVNKVLLPKPSHWSYGSAADPASIYVVYLEIWYKALNPADPPSSSGYFIDSNGVRYIYANGCINCAPSNLIPDDTIDPFQGLNTTSRGQIQWAIRTQLVPVNYDFTISRYGMDPIGDSTDLVYNFSNMGSINGDFGLWRNNNTPATTTLDNYTYAMPLAVVFQRNTGNFDLSLNPHGCADAQTNGSGVLASGVSGRFDFRYADVVYSDDVVDTRLTVSLEGYDFEKVLKNGFVDLVNGDLSQKIGRGESPGSDAIALGSKVPYTITLSPSPIPNTDRIGAFDGFLNGFGADARTFYAVKAVSINQKTAGTAGRAWTNGDAFVIDLGATGTVAGAVISYVLVQAIVIQPDQSKKAVLLMSGQVKVTGTGTRKATVQFVRSLGAAFDPGVEDLYVTVGVTYPAGSSHSLKKIPTDLAGGLLYDSEINKRFNVFGVSEYSTSREYLGQNHKLTVYNPQYSNKVFGVRAEIDIDASEATVTDSITVFTIPRTGINSRFSGLYVTGAKNAATGQAYPILSVSMDPGYVYVTLGLIPDTSTVLFDLLLNQTAQLSYNPAVKAVTAINETVLFGNYNSSEYFQMDNRIKIKSLKRDAGTGITTILIATQNGTLTGVGGDATYKYVFVADDPGHPTQFKAYRLLDVQFFNGCTTLVVPKEARVDIYNYFLVGSLAPAFLPASSLSLTLHHIPYQGEGDEGHTYSVLHSEEFALVTTNGTGSAPVVGLKDVYPYNREFPISAALPSQPSWDDAELANQAVSNYFDGNYEAKRYNNVEHTFMTPLHSNDFIEPVGGWKRKKLKFSFKTSKGFTKVTPHVGFAIKPAKPKEALGTNIVSTVAPLAIYVDNVRGNDSYDGLTTATPKRTIYAAVASLPPILRHPCFIYLVNNNVPYYLKDLKSAMTKVYLGDGDVQPVTNYCLASLGHTVQDSGRLYIGRVSGEAGYPEISALGYVGFGDGPTSAFIVSDTRVIFTGVKFSSFVNPAIYAVDSYLDFIDCYWENNFMSGSFTDGCSVTVSKGNLVLANQGTGFILEDSALTTSALNLGISGGTPNGFFICERTSNLTLSNHGTAEESGLVNSTNVVFAKLNSTVVCSKDFASIGSANIASNSVLTKTTKITPFAGGIVVDASSVQATDVS